MIRWCLCSTLIFLAGCGLVEFGREVAETPQAREGVADVVEGVKDAASGDFVSAAAKVAAGLVAIAVAAVGVYKIRKKKEAAGASS